MLRSLAITMVTVAGLSLPPAAGVPKAEAEREDIDGDDQLTTADWKFVDMSPQNGQGSAGSGASSQ